MSMRKGTTRATVLGLLLALVASLLTTVTPTTAPAQAMGIRMTGPVFRAWAEKQHIGPNAYTNGGKMTFPSFTLVRTLRNGTRVWRANTRVVNSPCYACMVAHRDAPAGAVVHPNSWYNPASWDWGGIFGKAWSMVKGCAVGSIGGVVSTGSGAFLANLLAKAQVVKVGGPYGYAAVAIGSCVWGAVGAAS